MNSISGDAALAIHMTMKEDTVIPPRKDCSFVVEAKSDSNTGTVLLSPLAMFDKSEVIKNTQYNSTQITYNSHTLDITRTCVLVDSCSSQRAPS